MIYQFAQTRCKNVPLSLAKPFGIKTFASRAHYFACYKLLLSNPYTSNSLTFTELRLCPTIGGWGHNSMTFTTTFLPSPSRNSTFLFFNESTARSFTPFTSLNVRRGSSRGKCTIWSVSKSWSVLHALTSSSAAECATLVSMTGVV